MSTKLASIPINKRIQLVEDIWDSIAEEQGELKITEDQKAELDNRLNAYLEDNQKGKPASVVFEDIKSRL